MNEQTHHHDASTPDAAEASEAETRDPVCGMKVKAGSPHVFTHDGEQYAFCSARCLENSAPSRQDSPARQRSSRQLRHRRSLRE